MKLSLGLRASVALLTIGVVQSFGQGPAVSPGGVVNAATFVNGQAVTPGSLVAIFGSGLAAQTALSATIPLSTSLNNVSVTFSNGSTNEIAPLSFVSATQINAQIPWDILNGASGTSNVIVTNNGVASAPQPVLIGPASPGIYATTDGHAIAINATDPTSQRYGTIAAPSGSIAGLTTFPTHVGDVLLIYATGLGAVDSPVANGVGSPDKIRNTVNKPVVLIGNTPATVLFSGLSTFVGAYQLNVTVPQVPSGNAVPIQLQLGGITTPSSTNIAVQ